MESYILDWLQLLFRWLHVITGVAWIGASFYFVWLDNHLEDPPRWKKDKGMVGLFSKFCIAQVRHSPAHVPPCPRSLAPATIPIT